MKIYEYENGVEYWYDRSTKCWWTAKFDRDHNQIGDAVHAYTMEEIIECAEDLALDGVDFTYCAAWRRAEKIAREHCAQKKVAAFNNLIDTNVREVKSKSGDLLGYTFTTVIYNYYTGNVLARERIAA
jgi:hypothetical protein